MRYPARVLTASVIACLLFVSMPLVAVFAEGKPYTYEIQTQHGATINVEPAGNPTEDQLRRCPKGGVLTIQVVGLFLREQTTQRSIRTMTAFTGFGCGAASTMGFLLEELEAVVEGLISDQQANGLFIETEYRRLEDEIQTRLHEAHVNNPADYQPTWITRSTTLTLNRVFLPGIAAW